MDGIIALLQDIFNALLLLLNMIVHFVTGFISVPGAFGLIVAALVFYLAWKATKNLLGAVLWLVVSFLVVYVLAAYVIWPFLFGGSHASSQSCFAAAGNDPKAIQMCNDISHGITIQQQPAAQQPVVVQPIVVQPTPTPQVLRAWKRDGLAILTRAWNLLPGDWPSKLPGQLVGPSQVPVGVRVYLVCMDCNHTNVNEIWQMTLTDTSGNMDPISLQVNGLFARESKGGFNASTGGSESMGTGTWETLCPSCYVDTIIAPTPTPAPVFPIYFAAHTLDVGGNSVDVCGWAANNALILCNENDQPGTQTIPANPADYPQLPHP